MFAKKTIYDIDLAGKKVILHGEFDAPLNAAGTKVTSDYRIASALPTIKYLQQQGCKIILISKLGRPKGKVDPKLSLKPVAVCLSDLLDQKVSFVPDCVGEEVQKASQALEPGQLLMLENLRFHPEEEENSEEFARRIVADSNAEVFVQDCFALAHRKEAGTDAITRCVPSVAGLHLQNEVETIVGVMENPARPVVAIIGGAKISDKIDVLNRFIDMADFVAIGGGMANTFLAAKGVDMGKSLVEKGDLDLARDLMRRAADKARKQPFIFYLPQDGVAAASLERSAQTRIVDWDAHVIADVENYPKRPPRASRNIADDEMILDIGPFSGAFIAGGIQLANTVIWNGAMGVTETPALNGPVGPFAHGTELVVEAMLGDYGHKPFSLVGGGDTVGYVEERGLVKAFNHVSTGGGASLELLAGRKLPAVEALLDKNA